MNTEGVNLLLGVLGVLLALDLGMAVILIVLAFVAGYLLGARRGHLNH
jgi:hypothetical protein